MEVAMLRSNDQQNTARFILVNLKVNLVWITTSAFLQNPAYSIRKKILYVIIVY